MTLENTSPHYISIHSGKDYLLTVSGGDLVMTYKTEAGSSIAVDGSPFTDGSQKIVCLASHDGVITINGTSPNMDVQLTPYQS